MQQTCILILGMHRSGTSALSGVLSMLDVYLGTNNMPGDKHNQKGYFENNNIVPLNEKLLKSIDSKWDDILTFHYYQPHLLIPSYPAGTRPGRRRGLSCHPLLLGDGRGEVIYNSFRPSTKYLLVPREIASA